jgi:hypothetical protein
VGPFARLDFWRSGRRFQRLSGAVLVLSPKHPDSHSARNRRRRDFAFAGIGDECARKIFLISRT